MLPYGFVLFTYPPLFRSRALRELFGAAYYPGPVREGEPASGERQSFVPGIFGNIFDVLVASQTHKDAIDSYTALVAGGRVDWSSEWVTRLSDSVRNGGAVVLSAPRSEAGAVDFVGVHLVRMTGGA